MILSTGWRTFFAMGLMAFVLVTHVVAAPPTVVISLKSFDELVEDADFIGEIAGADGVKELVEANLNAITGGSGLAGIDREKPLGLYCDLPAGAPNEMAHPIAFVPVADAEALKELIQKFVPDWKDNDGLWSATVNGQELFAKIVDDYCFFSNSADALKSVLDPEKIVNTNYDLTVELNLSSIPDQIKTFFLETTEREGRKGLENGAPPTNDAEAAGQKLGFEGTLAVLKSVVNDGDRLTFGLKADDETHLASIDLALNGKSNSTLAKAFAVYSKTTPAFAAVSSNDAPFRLLFSFPTTGMIAQFDEVFVAMRMSIDEEIDNDEKLKNDGDRKAAKGVAKRLVDVVQATVKSGSVHSILVLEEGENETVRMLGGTRVAKGDEAAKLLDDIAKLSKESPDFAKLKIDVAKHAGARIHSIEGDFDNEQAEMFGDNPAHLAFRPDSLWFSMGGGNLDALKTALDLSGKKVTKIDAPISLRVKPATMVTLMERKNEDLVRRAEALAGEPGDIVNVDIAPTENNGIKLRIEFGLDLIKLGLDK